MNNLKVARNIVEVAIQAVDGTPQDYTLSELKELIQEVLGEYEEDNKDFCLDILAGGECRIIDKGSIDEIWTESLIEQIKDCYDFGKVIDDLPSWVACSVDWEQTAENCKVDGLGHHFAVYDGEEHETDNHYIFRTN